MTIQDLNKFLEGNQYIEYSVDEKNEQVFFRNTNLDWYNNKPERSTAVKYWKIDQMSSNELMHEINRGLMVEGITRITGYFTKTSSWNPGKRGELKDRSKIGI
jgi:hypothetical protein